jgi:hypothetical protein
MYAEIDQKKLKVAIDWTCKLANGINPIDSRVIPDGDIVNNVHISRCLFFVSDLLEKISKGKRSSKKQYEQDFLLTPVVASNVRIVEKTGIAMFVREINKVIPENMKPLSAQKVTQWLVDAGYLEEREWGDSRKYKVPTSLGTSVGITSVWKEGNQGQYLAVSYDANAQVFLLENIFKDI